MGGQAEEVAIWRTARALPPIRQGSWRAPLSVRTTPGRGAAAKDSIAAVAGEFAARATWQDERYNNPAQPVVAVCWYEARAYCAWLSAQAGQPYRLPSEVEHEPAQRGAVGRSWAFGEVFDALLANTVETRLKRPSPVGVFVEGDTPEGASDLCGNVLEWTLSLYGGSFDEAEYRYPYNGDDGRENEGAGADKQRVARGGSWSLSRLDARTANRGYHSPGTRYSDCGFRVCAYPATAMP